MMPSRLALGCVVGWLVRVSAAIPRQGIARRCCLAPRSVLAQSEGFPRSCLRQSARLAGSPKPPLGCVFRPLAGRGHFSQAWLAIHGNPYPVAATPGMTLAIVADDEAADNLLRPAGIALLPRKCKWCPGSGSGSASQYSLGRSLLSLCFANEPAIYEESAHVPLHGRMGPLSCLTCWPQLCGRFLINP